MIKRNQKNFKISKMEILKSNSLNVKLVLMCVVDIFSKYAWAIS